MAEEVVFNLKVNGIQESGKSLNDLNQKIDDLKNKIAGADIGSAEFKELSTQLRNAQTESKQLEKTMEGVSTKEMLKSFIRLGEGINGAFAVTQLFNFGAANDSVAASTKTAQETIAKVLALRALAEGVVEGRVAARMILEKANVISLAILTGLQNAYTFATNSRYRAEVLSSAVQKGKIVLDKAQAIGTAILTGETEGLNAALLANPLVLIIAGIVALVLGIKKLYDNFAAVRVVMQAMFSPVTALIGLFKDLTGISSAESAAKLKEISEAKVKTYEDEADALDRLVKKKQIYGEQTYTLEKKALEDRISASKEAIKSLLIQQENADDKEKADLQKQIEEKQKALGDSYQSQLELDHNFAKEKQDFDNKTQELEIAAIKDDSQRKLAENNLALAKQIEQIKSSGQSKEDIAEQIAAVQQTYNNKLQKDTDDANSAALSKEKEKNQFIIDERNKLISTQDKNLNQQLELLKSSNEKEIESIKSKNLTASQLQEALGIQQKLYSKQISDAKYNDEISQQKKLLNGQKLILLQNLADNKITKNDYDNQLAADELTNSNNLLEIQKKYGKDTVEISSTIAQQQIDIAKQKTIDDSKQLDIDFDNNKRNLEKSKNEELSVTDLTESQKKDINTKYDIQELQSEADLLNQKILLYKKNGQDTADFEKQLADKIYDIHKAGEDAKTNKTLEEISKRKAAEEQTVKDASEIINAISNLYQAYTDAQNASLDDANADELKKNKEKYDAILANQQLSSEEKASIQKQESDNETKINADLANKKKELAKKDADTDFAIKSAQIIVSTAEAIMAALGELGPIAGGIAGVIIAATGAVQLAAANKQRQSIKSMAYGGIVEGNSHANGGVKYQTGGIISHELEGGEGILNKNSMQNPTLRSIASLINEAGGGISFSGINQQQKITQSSNDPLKVYVLESDISDIQKKKTMIQTRAKL